MVHKKNITNATWTSCLQFFSFTDPKTGGTGRAIDMQTSKGVCPWMRLRFIKQNYYHTQLYESETKSATSIFFYSETRVECIWPEMLDQRIKGLMHQSKSNVKLNHEMKPYMIENSALDFIETANCDTLLE